MRHLLPSPRSNREPRTEVAHLVLTLHRLASRPLRKATHNQGTVGTTIRENAPAAVTATTGDLTLRPPLATLLRDSRRMVTSPSPNVIVDAATTSASNAESPGTSTVTALAIHDQLSTTPVVPKRDPATQPQPRPNQQASATITDVAMVATAMDSLVKGTSDEPPLPSRLLIHQQNPQLLHPLHLAQKTRRPPSKSAEQGSPFPLCCTKFSLFVKCFFVYVT